MTTIEQKHPADELGKALARASGVLTLVNGCYDKTTGGFDMSLSYIYESISAVEGLLQSASDSLGKLYETCDLSVIAQVPAAPVAAHVTPPQQAVPQQALAQEEQMTWRAEAHAPAYPNGSYLGFFGPSDQTSNLSDRLDNILVSMPARPRSKQNETMSRPAQSYDELLEKVTALADAAAYQAHQTPGDESLVPALEGLRADLLRLKTA